MQQCIKILLFLILSEAQHVSGDTLPIIRSPDNRQQLPARPRPTAQLSPSSDGKPEAATAVVAPDDGHEGA